ncbi:hypothetical protein V6N12_065422 [Hibiscus sabdariffa]|uniref:Uncharacterized protein n=1 Tax=Hibiscus sabdariffa TaxID=183260 RepID=A0ABR2G9L7_9ROSI
MLPISCPSRALTAKKCSLKFTVPIQPSTSNSAINRRPNFIPSTNSQKLLYITLAKAEGGLDSTPKQSSPPPPPPPFGNGDTVFVGQEDVPLEGVIQFEKPSSSSRVSEWSNSRVALLSGGDVLALLLFSTIGRYNHGLPIFVTDTLLTNDPFLAGWFLSAYFLGGYNEDGRGANGLLTTP